MPGSECRVHAGAEAARALGLRVAAVDLFTAVAGDSGAAGDRGQRQPVDPAAGGLRARQPDPENLASHFSPWDCGHVEYETTGRLCRLPERRCVISRNMARAFVWRGWPTCSTPSRSIAQGSGASPSSSPAPTAKGAARHSAPASAGPVACGRDCSRRRICFSLHERFQVDGTQSATAT